MSVKRVGQTMSEAEKNKLWESFSNKQEFFREMAMPDNSENTFTPKKIERKSRFPV